MAGKQTTEKKEAKFAEFVDKMPQKVTRVVVVGAFRFKTPKMWGDQRKLTLTTGILKFMTSICLLVSLFFVGLTITSNQKNKTWDLFTFDQHGNIQWISGLEKLR